MSSVLAEECKEEQELAMKKEIKLLLSNLLKIKMKSSTISNSFHNNTSNITSRTNV